MESCEVRLRGGHGVRVESSTDLLESWVLCQIGVVVESSRSHDVVVSRRIAGERDGLLSKDKDC